ncbi:MAG TPA: L,D-transpeptidase family protein [Thermoanaerobaculia bacterium]|jgi:murein L,D-transpeptidase YcbB/YkuD|nr:L,D-transpeptidase family protein [Thermoanaerobaculia bacterium]
MKSIYRIRPWVLAALAAITAFALMAGCARKPGQHQREPLPPQVSQLLRETVQNRALPAAFKDQKELQRAWQDLRSFYDKRGYRPAWSDDRGPRPQAMELIRAIPPLAADGLDLRRYPAERLAALVKEVREAKSLDDPQAQRRLVDLDVELTYTCLALAAHLATGRLQPETLRVDWYTKRRNVDIESRLDQALTADSPGEIVKILRSLTPPYAGYQRLVQALTGYRGIAARGGWGEVPPGPVLKNGDRGPRVAALRSRLAASGDLAAPAPGAPAADSYDDAVAAGVSHFQRRHGLEAAGRVDADTLAALNVPVAERIGQLQVNLERWRWMPASLGDRYVLVNVPEFRLDVVDGGQTPLSMRVIVGKTQSRTPAFSDKMTFIELNPSWSLPDDIVAKEVAPKLARNPGYLRSHDMEVVKRSGGKEEVVDASEVDLSRLGHGSPYHLRERSGEENPLGKIKFMFPNEFDVYLHDTPSHHLFAKTERDFSHGCIRLEKPLDLAAYLLKDDPKWTPEAIQEAIDSGEHRTVSVPRPLPVHILYWTAWADADGTVEFRKDIYGHDAELEQALAQEPPVWVEPGTMRKDVRAAK